MKRNIKRKYIFISIIVVCILLGSLIFASKTDNNLNELKTSNDKTLLAVYLQDDNGEYTPSESNAFPTNGYALNLEKSTCQNGGVLSQDESTKKISVQVSKADRCSLYFDKAQESAEDIIARLIATAKDSTTLNFANPATTDEGVYSMEDDYGTSYFYRGAVTNNYVKFAGFYWRIIRINGDGSVRIRYDGTQAHANGTNSADRFTHTGQAYNANSNDAKYVGWMYGPTGTGASTSKAEAQTNTADSDIKKVVDTWYKTNIVDKNLSQHVADSIFCNDRSTPGSAATGWFVDTGLGYGTNATGYGATSRGGGPWKTDKTQPSFTCPNKNDAFTVEDETLGNGVLTYPVGLITADEIVATGSGKYGTENSSYYLYNPHTWSWSLSPFYYNSSASVFLVDTTGDLSNNFVFNTGGAIAPVINLTADYFKTLKGTGIMTDPFRAE